MLNEAVRIPDKHLLTLEPSISENQTNEMKSEQVQPVIPQGLHSSYTLAQQTWLINIAGFIDLTRYRRRSNCWQS